MSAIPQCPQPRVRKTSISVPTTVYASAMQVVEREGYLSLSEYITYLLRADRRRRRPAP